MMEASSAEIDIKEKAIGEWLKRVGPEQYLEHETEDFLVMGVSRGANRGLFGDDAMAVRELPGNGGLMISVVDLPPYDAKTSPEDWDTVKEARDSRLVAEAVAHELVAAEDPRAAAEAADSQKELAGTKGVLRPLARVKLTTDEQDRRALELSLSRGDVSVIAFIPDENGKFSLASIVPIYFNPQNDEGLNNPAPEIPEDGFTSLSAVLQDTIPEKEYIFRDSLNKVLPPGSFVIMASDGGLEALVMPGVLAAVGVVNEDILRQSPKMMRNALEGRQELLDIKSDWTEAIDSLKHALQPFLEILNQPASMFELKKLLRAIQTLPVLNDDATVVVEFVKPEKSGETEKREIPEFSKETYPLLMELAGATSSLPSNTDELLEKYGRETAILLVKELIEQDYTEFPRDYIFANACALVRIDWLPGELRRWFEQRGLAVVEGENIRVHLKHKDERRYGLKGCHEAGNLILFGEPGVEVVHIDTENEQPKFVADGSSTRREMSEKFPRGAWANVNVWDRLYFTVCGGYVAGTGPNARGILVPAGEMPIVYINTENSFTEGLPERNFYIRQGRLDQYGAYGLYALGKYLKGEIPALSREEIQSNKRK